MLRYRYTAPFVIVWGLFALLIGGVFYYPHDAAGSANGLSWLTFLVAVVIGGGLTWHGIQLWSGKEDRPRQNHRPALILGVIGVLVGVGSIPFLRPWAYDGLAGGLRAFGLGMYVICGGLFIATGVHCYRVQNQRIPLVFLAGLTGAGVFRPLDTSGITSGFHPLVWVAIVILFVGGPAITIYYGWPPNQNQDSTAIG